MRFTRLSDWLRWQETLNPRGIDLGLDRVRKVAQQMSIGHFDCPVITVGGTNGKGSCVAYLDSILRAAGYRTGAYTSPHILRYNERIQIDGVEVSDELLCAAFDAVEQGRGDVALTYFEFGTLAALGSFSDARLDAVILEVGLGGRLDAVNIVDPDVSLVASIGLDHTDWLGSNLDSIGCEKAGIFREARPAVYGDVNPPQGLVRRASEIGARLHVQGTDFGFSVRDEPPCWDWWGFGNRYQGLPLPALEGDIQVQNAASALAVLQQLGHRLKISQSAVAAGLRAARLPGRFHLLQGRVPLILDVAHNAEACVVLAANLRQLHRVSGRTLAIIGMLQDKPVEQVGRVMDGAVDAWYVGGLEHVPRGLTASELGRRLGTMRGPLTAYESVAQAFSAAALEARENDRILVFGSFHTLESVWEIAHG